MNISGVQCRPADHLSFRQADPERDEDYLGRPIPAGTLVIVRKADCGTLTKEGEKRINPQPAPILPQVPGKRRGEAYGQWRKQTERDGAYIDGAFHDEYWTCPYYYVVGRTVYLGSIYSASDPFEDVDVMMAAA